MKSLTVLYSSYHNYIDFSSGAALSMREVLLELSRSGARVRTLCGSCFDSVDVGEREYLMTLKALGIDAKIVENQISLGRSNATLRLVIFNDHGIEGTTFFLKNVETSSERISIGGRRISRLHDVVYLRLFLNELMESWPQFYCTYGGYPLAKTLADEAIKRSVQPVFFLHNAQYQNRRLFDSFSIIVTPSEYLRKYYQITLGRDSIVLPPIIDETNVISTNNNNRRYVTFVNPTPSKGLYPFITITRALNRLDPDVTFLLVETRNNAEELARIPESRELRNVYRMPSVRNVSAVYSQTRVLIAPSLCNEAFGRVVVEAAMNRIPTLCSNRGALPEVAGEPTAALALPERLTPYSRILPTEEELSPWIERILELWRDPAAARALGERLFESTARFRQKEAARRTREFFTHELN